MISTLWILPQSQIHKEAILILTTASLTARSQGGLAPTSPSPSSSSSSSGGSSSPSPSSSPDLGQHHPRNQGKPSSSSLARPNNSSNNNNKVTTPFSIYSSSLPTSDDYNLLHHHHQLNHQQLIDHQDQEQCSSQSSQSTYSNASTARATNTNTANSEQETEEELMAREHGWLCRKKVRDEKVLAAERERQLRSRSNIRDGLLNCPVSIPMPESDEHPRPLQLRSYDQQSEITKCCISGPPNKTVAECWDLPYSQNNNLSFYKCNLVGAANAATTTHLQQQQSQSSTTTTTTNPSKSISSTLASSLGWLASSNFTSSSKSNVQQTQSGPRERAATVATPGNCGHPSYCKHKNILTACCPTATMSASSSTMSLISNNSSTAGGVLDIYPSNCGQKLDGGGSGNHSGNSKRTNNLIQYSSGGGSGGVNSTSTSTSMTDNQCKLYSDFGSTSKKNTNHIPDTTVYPSAKNSQNNYCTPSTSSKVHSNQNQQSSTVLSVLVPVGSSISSQQHHRQQQQQQQPNSAKNKSNISHSHNSNNLDDGSPATSTTTNTSKGKDQRDQLIVRGQESELLRLLVDIDDDVLLVGNNGEYDNLNHLNQHEQELRPRTTTTTTTDLSMPTPTNTTTDTTTTSNKNNYSEDRTSEKT